MKMMIVKHDGRLPYRNPGSVLEKYNPNCRIETGKGCWVLVGEKIRLPNGFKCYALYAL
jgi:hypothetical protein